MNRRTLLLLAALSLVGCTRSKASSELKTLTIDEVTAKIALADGKTFVYDNNPRERFDKSHLPGARWLDFRSVKASDLPADRSATLIFYCANEL